MSSLRLQSPAVKGAGAWRPGRAAAARLGRAGRAHRAGVHERQLSLERPLGSLPVNLGFHTLGGPLLAVVGVCGGAGASTIAYLTAAAAAIESSAPVLLCDLGGPAAAIAAYANTGGGPSFTVLAGYLARGEHPPRAPFTAGEYGMRLLAAAPQLDQPAPEAGARAVIGQAVDAHALTVIDCAQLTRPVERLALEHATHVAWVMPATALGLRRARALLDVAGAAARGQEIVVARHAQRTDHPQVNAVAELAAERAATLVLVGQLGDIAENDTDRVLEQAAGALQALGGVLHR